jgi:heat shock protein HspQ
MDTIEFRSGQIITHKLFNYNGVILKVDQTFQLTDEWYEQMAKSKPPKNKPWYHVLVHNKNHTTYVAERNLKIDASPREIVHPLLPFYFTNIKNGIYQKTMNWEDENPLPLNNSGEA